MENWDIIALTFSFQLAIMVHPRIFQFLLLKSRHMVYFYSKKSQSVTLHDVATTKIFIPFLKCVILTS